MRVDEWPLPMELTEAEITLVKEDNRRRVKRVVVCVGVCMTMVAFLMVAFSLAMGSSIDRLVEDAWRQRQSGTIPSFKHSTTNTTTT